MGDFKIKQLEKEIEVLKQDYKEIHILVSELIDISNSANESFLELHNKVNTLKKKGNLYVCK